MIKEIYKLAIAIEDDEALNVVSLIQNEGVKILAEVDVIIRNNFTDFIYSFYKRYVAMEKDLVFSLLNLSRFNFKEELFSKSNKEIKAILNKAEEIRSFLNEVQSTPTSSYLKKVASNTLFDMILNQFQILSESSKSKFLEYSQDIQDDVDNIIEECLIIISKRGDEEYSEKIEDIFDSSLFTYEAIDRENQLDEESPDFESTAAYIKDVFKSNLSKLIDEYINNQSNMENHINGFRQLFKSKYLYNHIAGMFAEDVNEYTGLYQEAMIFVHENKDKVTVSQHDLSNFIINKLKSANLQVTEHLLEQALSGFFSNIKFDFKNASKELLENAKFLFSSSANPRKKLNKSLGVYTLDKFDYDIENVIIINLEKIISAKGDLKNTKIDSNVFYKQLYATIRHEFEHYLDYGLPKLFLIKNMNIIKNRLSAQLAIYKSNPDVVLRSLRIKIAPTLFQESFGVRRFVENLKNSHNKFSSEFNSDISNLASLLNIIKNKSRSNSDLMSMLEGIFLNGSKARFTEILVRINSLSKTLGGSQDKFSSILNTNLFSFGKQIKDFPNDAQNLIEICYELNNESQLKESRDFIFGVFKLIK